MATSTIPYVGTHTNGTWSDTDFNNITLAHKQELWLINNSSASYSNAPTGFSGRGSIVGVQPVDGVFLIMLYDSAYGKAWLRCKWWTSWDNWAEIT